VLQGHIKTAHTQSQLATGFAHTYLWVMGVTLVGLLPTFLLMRIERRTRRQESAALVSDDAALLEAA
jgi:formate-dependent nitrite reductase membrane component NrfD